MSLLENVLFASANYLALIDSLRSFAEEYFTQ